MPSFHAAFSLGGMIGAGLGGLVAGSLSPTRHLLGLTVVGLLVTAVAGRALLRTTLRRPREPEHPAAEGAHRAAWTPVRAGWSIVFGLIALCTAYGEGALADWGALHLEQDLDASPRHRGRGLLLLRARHDGRPAQRHHAPGAARADPDVVAGGAMAAAGMLLGSLAPSIWVALLGFAVTGLGLANIFPVAVERAGALAGPSGVAVASTLGYGGMLLGPPAIGFMADWFSLPVALTSVAALAAVAAVIGYGTRRATAD